MNIDAAPLQADILNACRTVYGDRLVSLAIFGSWARGEATPVSDLDLLVVADPLPAGRMKRVREFRPVEAATAPARSRVWPEASEPIRLSLIFKTPLELAAGYLRKCLDRLAALDVLLARGAFSDVVRESQEVVELALTGNAADALGHARLATTCLDRLLNRPAG